MAFCRWLSRKTGREFTLPTEAQWEYACRAGTATPLWYGTVEGDFSRVANLSDLSHQTIDTFGDPDLPDVIAPWRPADARFDDHSRVSAPVGSYRPNPWGLFDMHGNVAEWTRSEYRAYPYRDDGRNGGADRRQASRPRRLVVRPARALPRGVSPGVPGGSTGVRRRFSRHLPLNAVGAVCHDILHFSARVLVSLAGQLWQSDDGGLTRLQPEP